MLKYSCSQHEYAILRYGALNFLVLSGRRAKRAMKREAADRAAAAKHQQRLQRFGLVDAINNRTAVSQE
jgi:hypothetical protein